MMNLSEDIQSLSHFKRNTSEELARLKMNGRPLVLTVNGKAEAVVQDAKSYQRLCELVERAEMMAFLLESKADVDAGRTVPALDTLDKLAKKHKIRGSKP